MATKHRYMTEGNVQVLIELIKQKFTDYLTDEQIQKAIADAMAEISTIEFKKVDSLPPTGETNYIYLVPNSLEGDNVYDEYFWDASASKFEILGQTNIDLSDYVLASDLEPITNDKISELWTTVMTPSEDVE